MANETKIQVVITADASGAVTGIRMAQDATKEFSDRTQSLTQSLKNSWVEFAAGVAGAYLALQKMWGWMDQAAQLEERMDTLNRLTQQYGISAEDLTGAIQRNSRGLIGMKDAADVAADALAKGFTPEQIAQMASWAETAQETTAESISVGEAFRSMEQAITAARERGVVKMFGATIDLESALGDAATTMSKAEKAQALFNLVAEEAEKRQQALGEKTDSAADRMERFTNSINQAKTFLGQLLLVIGQPFMAVFNVALTLAYSLAGAIGTVAATLAKLTDDLGFTKDKASDLDRWAASMYANAAKQGEQALENVKGALSQIADLGSLKTTQGGTYDTTIEASQKQLDKLAELKRKWREEEEAASVAEMDRELVRINGWYEEQVKTLDNLGARQADYDALYAAYSAKWDKAKQDRDAKIASDYTKWIEKRNEEEQKANTELANLEIAEKERSIREQMALDEKYRKAGWGNESAWIKEKGTQERALLELEQSKVLLKMDEAKTDLEMLVLAQELAAVQAKIEESKRNEAADLDLRRLALEREITELTQKQAGLKQAASLATAQEYLGKLGASDLSSYIGDAESLAGGLADVTTGKDAYSVEYQKWAELQDRKIQAMEEYGASEAAIKDAYREYDLKAEEANQNQKLALTSTALGIMSSLAESAYNLTGKKGGAAFEAFKAIKIAETIVNTYSAAMAAFNALACIPIVGPALGAAAAAATIAFGMAQVQSIASMKPGGSSSVSTSSVDVGSTSSSTSTSTDTTAEEAESAPSQVVNIHIYGNVVDQDAFARELIPSITKALGDNVQ